MRLTGKKWWALALHPEPLTAAWFSNSPSPLSHSPLHLQPLEQQAWVDDIEHSELTVSELPRSFSERFLFLVPLSSALSIPLRSRYATRWTQHTWKLSPNNSRGIIDAGALRLTPYMWIALGCAWKWLELQDLWYSMWFSRGRIIVHAVYPLSCWRKHLNIN